MPVGIYIHIPFCLKKCNYCDFISYPVATAVADAYLAALAREMAFYRRQGGEAWGEAATLYLGGGTPTVLSPGQLRRLLTDCQKFFPWRPEAEVTVEANPGTLTEEKLQVLRAAGVNRLSIGAQSFAPRHLLSMGRQHGVKAIGTAVELARQAGFDNLSLDLIYGLPGQTLADWSDSVRQALELEPEHLSAYGLKIEAGTPWGDLAEAGQIAPATDELARLMYDEVRAQCAARGLYHYEISNFAKTGCESRHNSRYWLLQPYLGLGVAAASYCPGRRWTNMWTLEEYQRAVAADRAPVGEEVRLSEPDEMAETVILGLRMIKGVSLNAFQQRFGASLTDIFAREIHNLLAKDLVELTADYLRLTPGGLPLANEVFQAFV